MLNNGEEAKRKRIENNSKVVLKYCEDIPKPKIIEFGGGKARLELPFKVDQLDFLKLEETDIVADLEKPLPIGDNTYNIIFSSSVFEHVYNNRQLHEECWRILKPKGLLIYFVPHFASMSAYHPEHKTFFSSISPSGYTEDNKDFNFITNVRFKVIENKITSPIKFLEPLINLNKVLYEGSILKNIIPSRFLFVVLEAKKC
jgi:SAM-dependent methyltransferase